ncbi:DNA cytosine methyltransferase [Nocardioides sp. YIM 152315]|uniref:DNA cytosine methyltransferase n=1 Tax=Nocardioides sp. YIM 152315 TaxID=3031760 RepID=UPI0023DB12C4|nr:DNA cytosine methyltransferase [Nocardioides sp. YIM 152315]MDF1605906.1 DNA cytosine methyltransferase [Nocardioides sp. YIM 152315]
MPNLTCVEICAGAGGQSVGLEMAGFDHTAAVEIDADACATLRLNRPKWNVIEKDVKDFDITPYAAGLDLLAGGVPCPPFSIAGKQLGADDERDLFPEAMRLVREGEPKAVMLENVRGLASSRFDNYRESILDELRGMDYEPQWQLFHSSEFGVPQLRPRFILVALQKDVAKHFSWPTAVKSPMTVGEALHDLMAADGWPGAEEWATKRAIGIGPTIVGGSRKHGGPDLGPTRARASWAALGVDGRGIADAPPTASDPIDHMPRLTREMAARIQGFDPDWKFYGKKTAAYRQIGNAFPPPVAAAIGGSIASAIRAANKADKGKSKLRAVAS